VIEWADFLRQYGAVIAGVVSPMLVVAIWGIVESGRDMNE
jgi:hypothetical protein